MRRGFLHSPAARGENSVLPTQKVSAMSYSGQSRYAAELDSIREQGLFNRGAGGATEGGAQGRA